jgi:predicted CoA-binding protein
VKSIAVLGASADRSKFGNKAVRAFQSLGLPAFASVKDLPETPNLISVYLPPPVTLKLLPDIAARGCDELWLNPGAESPELVHEATRLGLRVTCACSIVAHGLSPEAL